MSDDITTEVGDDFWDEFASAFVKWEKVGDSVVGKVVEVQKGQDFNGAPCPQLVIEKADGEKVTLTAGQAQLRGKIVAARPRVGQKIRVKFVSETKVDKGMRKDFEVEVEGAAVADEEAPF